MFSPCLRASVLVPYTSCGCPLEDQFPYAMRSVDRIPRGHHAHCRRSASGTAVITRKVGAIPDTNYPGRADAIVAISVGPRRAPLRVRPAFGARGAKNRANQRVPVSRSVAGKTAIALVWGRAHRRFNEHVLKANFWLWVVYMAAEFRRVPA